MLPPRFLKLLAAAGLVALAVSACGRRGSLEPPDTRADAGPRAGARASGTGGATGGTTVAGGRNLPTSVGLGGGSAEPDPAAVQAGDELPLSAIPPSGTEAPVLTERGAKRGYTVPKQPFFLDPIL
jgi:predicted small lipoprotein YifL